MKKNITASKVAKALRQEGVSEEVIESIANRLGKTNQPVRFKKDVLQRAEVVFNRDGHVIICGPTQRVFTQKGFEAMQKSARSMRSKRPSVYSEQELPLESVNG